MPTQNSAADILSSQWTLETTVLRPSLLSGVGVENEFELLRACCGAGTCLVSQALDCGLQWDRVFNLATYHRALPALYTALQGQPEVPASIQSALQARFVRHCQRVMRFSAALAEILRRFESQGIPVIAQKGPALAHLLYGDSAMREFGDLDLLVRPSDVPRAVASLRELGYDQNLQLSPRQAKAYLRSGYEYVFGRGAERNLVELQWNLLPRFYAVDFDIEALFERSRELHFEGLCTRVLRFEDQMLFLCVHAAKHQWAQLGMVRDIAALTRLGLDWNWVLVEARRLGVERIVSISLLLSRSVCGTKIPAGISDRCSVPENQQLAAAVHRGLAENREIPVESTAYFRFMMQLRERRLDRARSLWRLATTASVGEWETLRIPDALFPLYSGVRFFRLAHRMVA